MKIYFFLLSLLVFFSCKRKWSEKDKSDFFSGCMSKTISNKDVKDPKLYCNCLLQKIVAKYPNANDAEYIRYDSAVVQLAKECLKQQ